MANLFPSPECDFEIPFKKGHLWTFLDDCLELDHHKVFFLSETRSKNFSRLHGRKFGRPQIHRRPLSLPVLNAKRFGGLKTEERNLTARLIRLTWEWMLLRFSRGLTTFRELSILSYWILIRKECRFKKPPLEQ
jgi:hypothetical protein